MNNEPMNAPAKPAVAGELRESGLVNICVLKVRSIIPLAAKSSDNLRTSGLNCCCSSGSERSIFPANHTSIFASVRKLSSSF